MISFFKKSPKEAVKLPIYTDIHCHIVPGVDDGSPDVDTSIELLTRMHGWGLKRIYASPHVADDVFENSPDTLDPALEELQEAVKKNNLDLEVERHAEYRIGELSNQQIEQGIATTLPKDYILIENSFMQEPWELENVVFNLKLKGLVPILAHPERYKYYNSAGNAGRQRYAELHHKGLLFQTNILSLAGQYGSTDRETAEWLISMGFVDFLGTDLHSHRHADTIDAYLRTNKARKHFEALNGRLLNDTL